MARVQPEEVEGIAEFGDITGTDLQPFIDDAHTIVQTRVQDAVDEKMLPQVEKWLAAHLASMREKRVSTEAIGQSELSFEGESGLGLRNTRYGQQVLIMVPRNVLANASGSHYVRTVNSDEED